MNCLPHFLPAWPGSTGSSAMPATTICDRQAGSTHFEQQEHRACQEGCQRWQRGRIHKLGHKVVDLFRQEALHAHGDPSAAVELS